VHAHERAVPQLPHVEFLHADADLDRGAERRERVLRVSAAVAAVRGDERPRTPILQDAAERWVGGRLGHGVKLLEKAGGGLRSLP
jgi:hypothetical protein